MKCKFGSILRKGFPKYNQNWYYYNIVLIKTVKDFASLKKQLKDTDNCCFHQTD